MNILTFALIMTESGNNPKAETPWARGLMGVSKYALEDMNDIYGTNYTYDDLFDPNINIEIGEKYFMHLLKYWLSYLGFKDKTIDRTDLDNLAKIAYAFMLADMSYNWGVGNVKKWLLYTEADNSKIDEAVPKETKAHLLDHLWWGSNFILKPDYFNEGGLKT